MLIYTHPKTWERMTFYYVVIKLPLDNYFKRRTRALNEIAGRDARGMNDYETPVLFPIPHKFIESNTGRPLTNNPGYKN